MTCTVLRATVLHPAVGGDFPGPNDATTPFPSPTLVDDVHVYP